MCVINLVLLHMKHLNQPLDMSEKDVKNNLDIGKLGENIACRFLEEKGYTIAQRNYRKKWGEIDIIAESSERKGSSLLTKISSFPYKTTYFIEVKTNSFSIGTNQDSSRDVTHETEKRFNPLDNMHPRKIERLKKAIESYLSSNVSHGTDKRERFLADNNLNWEFGVVAVWVDVNKKRARVKFIENVVL